MYYLNRKICISLMLILLGFCSTIFAEKISKVEFEQKSSLKLPEEQLAFNVRVRPGLEFSQESLDEDVRRLFNSGNFSDVVAETEKTNDGKIKVIFKVKLKPRISLIEYRGNAKYKVEELVKKVSVVQGGLLNDKKLRESLNELRKFYVENGYKNAIISHALLPDGDDKVILVFNIKENLKQKVNDVTFEGAKVYSQSELRSSIANQYSYMNLLPFINDYLNHGLFDAKEIARDEARLRDLYHEKGYLDFKVDEVIVTPLEDDPEFVNITYKISEGEPYKIGKISFSGNNIRTVEDLDMLNNLVTGEVFSLSAERSTIDGITGLYDVEGYADISVQAKHNANFQDHIIDIDFEVDEGRKYNVRDVIIAGNTLTKDKVIRRELAILPGDPLDPNRIEVSRQRLMGMGYFQKVDASAVAADALNEKDVLISLEEKPDRYNFRLGVGFSDINSLAGMAVISTNNFDITSPENWFYGGGQRFRIQGVYGFENAGFNVDFVEPWLFDIPLRLELSGYLNEVEYDDWNESRLGGRASLGKKLFDDFTTFTVGYKFEAVKLGDIDDNLKYYMKATGQDKRSYVSALSMIIDRDTRDNFINPTSGYNVNLFGLVSPEFIGSTYNFYKLEAKGSYYHSFFDKAIVAMVGVKFGVAQGFGGDEVPVYERYFMGGTDSLRGFDYRTVSPRFNGKAIGGNTMLLATTEVSHPIYGPVRGAFFVDAGNVWAESYSMGNINMGVGYGLRIQLPVLNAPIKVDLAYPVINNQDGEKSKLRFHFNMGFTF